MARTKKDVQLRQKMCERLRTLVQDILELSDKEASDLMGYSNSTTLWRVWQGQAFPDAERLYRIAGVSSPIGSKPSLHWIITGEGAPLIEAPRRELPNESTRVQLLRAIQAMPASKIESFLSLLSD